MVEAVGADDRIKAALGKRQVLAVAHHELGVGQVLGLCHMDHLRCEVQAHIVLFRVLLVQQFQHGAGAAAAVQHAVERLFFQLSQNGRIIVLAHLINAGVAAVVDLGRLGEFLDGKILVFFRCHSVLPLIQRCS